MYPIPMLLDKSEVKKASRTIKGKSVKKTAAELELVKNDAINTPEVAATAKASKKSTKVKSVEADTDALDLLMVGPDAEMPVDVVYRPTTQTRPVENKPIDLSYDDITMGNTVGADEDTVADAIVGGFPWGWLLFGGLLAAGAAAYLLTKDDDDDEETDTTVGASSNLNINDNVGAVTGTVAKNATIAEVATTEHTDDTTPTYTGTAGKGATSVIIYDKGVAIATVPVATDGTWTYTSSTLTTGSEHIYTNRGVNVSGNTSAVSTPWAFVVDTGAATGAPDVPSITQVFDDKLNQTGVVQKNGTTNDETLVITGTATANTTVTVFSNGTEVGTAAVDANGDWKLTSTKDLGVDGLKNITAQATNTAGVKSTTTGIYPIILDRTNPENGTWTLDDNVGASTGAIAEGATTDDRTPTLNGQLATTEAGSTVTVYMDNKEVGTAVVGADGKWSLTSTTLANGNHAAQIKVTDLAGNTSALSTAKNFIIDATGVLAVDHAVDNVEGITGNVVDAGVTNDKTPQLVGTATANSTVTITDPTGATVTAVANANGIWTAQMGNQNEGVQTFNVTSISPDQVVGKPTSFKLNVDTTASSTGTPIVTDDVGRNQGTVTKNSYIDDTTPTIQGENGKAGDTVTVYDNGVKIGTTTVNPNGKWSFSSSVLPDGKHDFQVTMTDPAGNTSDKSTTYPFYIDTVAPNGTSGLDLQDDIGSKTGQIDKNSTVAEVAQTEYTDDTKPTYSGSAPTDAVSVIVYDKGIAVATVPVTNGKWSYTSPTALTGDHIYTSTAIDEAGNESAVSTPWAFVIGQAATTVSVAITDPDKDNLPTATGTADPSSTVTITWPNGSTITTKAGTDGKYSVESLTPQTSGTVTATSKTPAGLTSEPAKDAYKDVTDPIAPTVKATDPDGDEKPTATGSAEPLSTVMITWPDKTTSTTTANSLGKYEVVSPVVQPEGSVTATAIDLAKNTSPSVSDKFEITDELVVTVVSTDPDLDDKPTATGSTEAGATVKITWPDGSTITTKAGTDGKYTVESLTTQTTGTVTATATDKLGNTSAPDTDKYEDKTAPTVVITTTTDPDLDNKPTVTGSTEPSATVKITWPDGSSITTKAGTDGKYTVESLTPQTSGTVTATATDKVGNSSAPATGKYIDVTDPITPTIQVLEPTDPAPTAIGTGEPGTKVTVTWPTGVTSTATVATDGTYKVIAPTVQPGEGTVTVTGTDKVGNTSTPGTDKYDDKTGPAIAITSTTDPDKDNKPTVTGTTEPSATVKITWPDGSTITTKAGTDGKYTVESLTTQNPGTVTATATDKVGNSSSPATGKYIDVTDPVTPTIQVLEPTDPMPTAIGTGEPGSKVTVTWPTGVTSTTTVASDGTYKVTAPTVQPTQGTVTATSEDKTGNTSGSGTDKYEDKTAPTIAITSTTDPDLDNKPTVTGTTEPSATVKITWPNGSTITTVADTNGKYTVESLTTQASGTVTATATDKAGNSSSPATGKYTDITDPVAPTIQVLEPTDPMPTAIGTGEPGSKVTVTWPTGVTSTTTVASDGTYKVTAPTVQPTQGTVTATTEDKTGNTSGPGTDKYEDKTAPTIAITSTNDPDLDNKPTVTGTTEPSATVKITWPNGSTITTVADTNGKYTVESLTTQTSGTVTATATDKVGNSSTPATGKYIDVTDPVAPTIQVLEPTDPMPTAIGTGEPGSKVTVTWPTGVTSTTTVASDGTYKVTAPTVQPTQGTATATSEDKVGNTSAPGTDKYEDKVAPTIAITSTNDPDLDNKPTVTGTTEANATVKITWPDGSTITTIANSSGKYTVESLTTQNPGTVTATATDKAGNSSTPATGKYVDLTGPAVTVTAADPDADDLPTATGTTEPNAIVKITWPDGSSITTKAGADGKYSVEALTPQTTGNVTAVATDTLGNSSTLATTKYTDVTKPERPLQLDMTTATDSGVVTTDNATNDTTPTYKIMTLPKTGEEPRLYVDGVEVAAVYDRTNMTLTPVSPIAKGSHNVQMTYVDQVGNISALSVANLTTIYKDPTISVTGTVAGDGVITANEPAGSIRGTTTDVAEGRSVILTYTDAANHVVTATTTVDASGNWVAPTTNLSSLNDGTITLNVATTDKWKNPTSTVKSVTLDLVANKALAAAVVETTTVDSDSDSDTTIDFNSLFASDDDNSLIVDTTASTIGNLGMEAPVLTAITETPVIDESATINNAPII